MTKGKKFFLGMAVLLMSASLFILGCSTEADPEIVYRDNPSNLPADTVDAANEAVLRSLLVTSGVTNIAYSSNTVSAAELVIPAEKNLYLTGSGTMTLGANFVVESSATLVIARSLATGAGKLLVNGTVKVYGSLATGANALDVTGYTGTNTTDGATAINTAKVQVLAGGTLILKAVDMVAAADATANKFTLAQAWSAAGEGGLIIDGATAVFTVAELVAQAQASTTRRLRAETTDPTATVPPVIPRNADITASAVITSVTGSGTTLTVNGTLTAANATLASVSTIIVGPGGELTAVSAVGASGGVVVQVGAVGSATLDTVAQLDATSSVGVGAGLTVVATAFDSGSTLAVGAGATVNGVTFPVAATVQGTAIGATALTIAGLTVPAGATFTVPAGTTVTVDAGETLTINGTLAFEGATSTVVIQAGGSITAPATGVFSSKSTVTDGSGVSLTVAATATPTSATGYTSNNATQPAAVTLTTAAANTNSGATAYVIGNASFAVNNVVSTAAPVTPVESSAAVSNAVGTITADTDSAVVLVGEA